MTWGTTPEQYFTDEASAGRIQAQIDHEIDRAKKIPAHIREYTSEKFEKCKAAGDWKEWGRHLLLVLAIPSHIDHRKTLQAMIDKGGIEGKLKAILCDGFYKNILAAFGEPSAQGFGGAYDGMTLEQIEAQSIEMATTDHMGGWN